MNDTPRPGGTAPARGAWLARRARWLADATPHTLGVLRVLVFGACLVAVSTTPLVRIADPAAAPAASGAPPLSVVEGWISNPALLVTLQLILAAGLVACTLGLRPFRAFAIPTWGLLVAFAVLRGGLFPWETSGVTTLLVAWVLALTPSADLVSILGPRPGLRRDRAAATLLAIAGIVAVVPAATGAGRVLRFVDSVALYERAAVGRGTAATTRALDSSIERWRGDGRPTDPPARTQWLLKQAALRRYVAATVVAAAAILALVPLAFVWGWFRHAWLAAMTTTFAALWLLGRDPWPSDLFIAWFVFTPVDRVLRPRPRADGPILFFDGECGLCNRVVRHFLDRDLDHVLRFAPLQGETAQARLPAAMRAAEGRDPDSVVLLDEDGPHERSDAALRALGELGGLWAVVGPLLRAVPRTLRDRVYGFIARNRYRWFGRVEACALITPEQRVRILP